ncbi:hypothetical protein ACRALDRAFT_209342 [Sodiomyces alcalophilus JCM 7366]|uniref:uncharacterized protein n=1 Tax=Sodiomyces alcalophilus JCM 7366 TaxID=591952 RepID=UPI0039B40F88
MASHLWTSHHLSYLLLETQIPSYLFIQNSRLLATLCIISTLTANIKITTKYLKLLQQEPN